MATIHMSRRHRLNPVDARERVAKVAETLKLKFGADYRWEDDRLHLKRAGADGTIDISKAGMVTVNVRLGLALRPMKTVIENSILKGFDQVLEPDEAT